MGHKDLGVRKYNPSLAAQGTKEGKSYLKEILQLTPYERLLYWIKERHNVHVTRFPKGFSQRATGSPSPSTAEVYNPETPKPWTNDPILQTVFFCNPYRENDKVTAYLRDNYREPQKEEPSTFLGTILLRWFNYIPTMQKLITNAIAASFSPKGTWAKDKYLKLLLNIRDNQGVQLFGGAYIIRPIVDGDMGTRKVEGIGELMTRLAQTKTLYKEILGKADAQIDPTPKQLTAAGSVSPGLCAPGTMSYAFARLSSFPGMGGFYCYQFLGDLAYTHVLRDASDWFTWGYCGPGTARGLVRLRCDTGKAHVGGKPLPRLMSKALGQQQQHREHLLELQEQINNDLCKGSHKPKSRATQQNQALRNGGEVRELQPLHMRDLCNCLCEYDKYERALFNERSIKRPYRGN